MSAALGKTPAYYVPEQSKLPIWMAFALFLTVIGTALMLQKGAGLTDSHLGIWVFFTGALVLAATMYNWFVIVAKENMAGMNSAQLKASFVYSMKWFIVSETMFFAAFFGGLFYIRLFELPWMGGEGAKAVTGMLYDGFTYTWPLLTNPIPAEVPGPREAMHWTIPLINTILLVSSSVTLHFAHHGLIAGHRKQLKMWLLATIALALVFLCFQIYEYYEAYAHLGLTLNSGIYGSTFFILTGFHGAHVILGSTMLIVMAARVFKGHFTANDHFGFEATAWYWHFVDVVWLILFVLVYLV
ncbi:MAG: cytochrome c oxidase subunit 3 [Natronospirillum sp.]